MCDRVSVMLVYNVGISGITDTTLFRRFSDGTAWIKFSARRDLVLLNHSAWIPIVTKITFVTVIHEI